MSDAVLLRAINEDRSLGSSILFNHRHTHSSPAFHVEIIDLWRCADELVLIEAFRDAAKSTLSEEFLAMEGCFGNFRYCLLVGETYAKACQRLEAIAFEAGHNQKLKNLFGKVLSRKPIENKVWFASGALIEAVGWEQELRSFKYHTARPDRAYLDDVENLETVRDSAAVDRTIQKLWRELVPAMDAANRKIRITQTPLAPDCMVTRLRDTPDFVVRSFPICNGDIDDPRTESAWPERFPMSWIKLERDRYAGAGMLREFMQERMLQVDTAEAKPFREEMLRAIDIAPAAWLPRYGIWDPSRTATAGRSDRTGKVVVSRLGSRIIVHDSGGYYWKPDEIRRDVFDTHEKHHLAAVGIEKNSLDEFLLQPIRMEMIRRGVALPLKPLQAPQDRDKLSFIMGLQPFFASGEVLLVGGRGAHPQLVAEILNFPGGSLDVFNALAYALRMFAGALVYEDFGEGNVAPSPEAGKGETVYVCWNASPAELVAACVIRHGRHLSVARDYSGTGALSDIARSIIADIGPEFRGAAFHHYVPAELHDNFRRVPLVQVLRDQGLKPWRSENSAVARGSLAERIRTRIRDRALLSVDARAKLMLNALAGEYKYPVVHGGKQGVEPAIGVARLVVEAVECLTALIDKGVVGEVDEAGYYGHNAQGIRYRTSLPRR